MEEAREKSGQPETETDDGNTEAQVATADPILPDEDEVKPTDAEKASEQLKTDLAATQTELKAEKEKSEKAEQRVKDAQSKMHLVTEQRVKDQTSVAKVKPGETLTEYTKKMGEMHDDDPRAAYLKTIEDFAKDRDYQEALFSMRLKEVEDRAYQRALKADPDRAVLIQEVERLSTERPDLDNLSFDQKLELMQLKKKAEALENDEPSEDRSLINKVSGRNNISSRKKSMPDWVNDPKVLEGAKESGQFTSKQDLLDWNDPEKARLMSLADMKNRIAAEATV